MEVKLLDRSWITNVEVRFAALFRFGLVCSVDPCLTPGVRVLVSPTQSGQTCCLVRLVLRFYIERVFGNYPSPQPEDRRCCSALANSFITIRRSIHKCVSAPRRLAARLGYECH